MFNTKRQTPSIYRSLLVVFFWRTFSATFPSPRPKRQGSTDSANIYREEEEGRGRRLPPRVRSRKKRRSLLSLSLCSSGLGSCVRWSSSAAAAAAAAARGAPRPPIPGSPLSSAPCFFAARPCVSPRRVYQEAMARRRRRERERKRANCSRLLSPFFLRTARRGAVSHGSEVGKGSIRSFHSLLFLAFLPLSHAPCTTAPQPHNRVHRHHRNQCVPCAPSTSCTTVAPHQRTLSLAIKERERERAKERGLFLLYPFLGHGKGALFSPFLTTCFPPDVCTFTPPPPPPPPLLPCALCAAALPLPPH